MEKETRPQDAAPFRELLSTTEPYLFCSPAGRVIYASGGMKILVDEDLTGRNLNDFLEDALAARLVADGQEGRTRTFRCQIGGKHFSAEATPWDDAPGMQLVFFPLNAQTESDRWSDPEQNLFISREINQELAGMLPVLDDLPENGREAALLRRSIFRLLRLSRNLQDGSLVSLGGMEAHYRQVDMTAFMTELLDQLEPICQAAKVILRRELPQETLNCRADPELLRRMVCNLMSNALRAQPMGGAVDVSLKAESGEQLALTVIDHGPGADGVPDTTFRRRSQRELLTRPGVGLGLSLTRAFAELQGGRLLLMSSGSGVVAKIILPRNGEIPLDQLHNSMRATYGVGLDPVLVEMSTAADWELYRK